MRKAVLLLLVLAIASFSPAQDAGQQAQPQAQPVQPPPSMQQGVQEPLPPPPPQVQVKATNLVEKAQTPTDADVYCSGFIASEEIPSSSFVRAGWDTPDQTRFTDNEYVYLQGKGFQDGQRFSLVRKLRDPNRWEAFPAQRRAIANAGQPYADVAEVEVVKGGARGDTAITVVRRSCEPIVPGDYAVPFVERPHPQLLYTGEFDQFAPENGKLAGRIVLSRDFDQVLGTGKPVYLNVGANQGVKVGDYFRVTRSYVTDANDPVGGLSYKASTTEDTQANTVVFPKNRLHELPRKSLGQLIILNVHPKSATGMITFAIEDVKVGDTVEMFEPPPPPPPPAPAASTMPTISCAASPDTVHKGESSTITCQAASPDNHPLSVSFATSAGGVTPHDNNATLDTAQVAAPMAVTVTGTVTDDRNQSANSSATVNVQPPAAPPAPTSQAVNFRRGSAYVDNRAKALLDGVALQLQQQADATAVVIGHSMPGEAKSLANRRAVNVKNYLTQSKGIDPKRIETRTGTGAGMSADVWIVPAGAGVPADAGSADSAPDTTAAPAPAPRRHKKKAAAAAPATQPK